MSEKNIKRLHIAYSILLSVLLTAVAIMFIVSSIGIYKSADSNPYTVESISRAFSKIAFPVYLCIAVAVGGFILNTVLPLEKKKLKGAAFKLTTLHRLSSKLNIDSLSTEDRNGILTRRTIRRMLIILEIIDLTVHAVVILKYALNPDNFTANAPNTEILKGTILILSNLVMPFIISVAFMLISRKLIAGELALVKKAIVAQKSAEPHKNSPEDISQKTTPKCVISKIKAFFAKNERALTWGSRIVVAAAGILFIGLGIWNGGASDVVRKAINICTECIGLG